MMEEIKSVKYYVIILLMVLGGYAWATINGYKIIGDDNQSKENKSGYTRSYYHK